MKQKEIKLKTRWNNFLHRNKTFITCKDCGIKRWVKNETINIFPNRKIYCWECDSKREQAKNHKKYIKEEAKRQKIEKKIYCKDKEHNYLGTYNKYSERVEYICSKCGKSL